MKYTSENKSLNLVLEIGMLILDNIISNSNFNKKNQKKPKKKKKKKNKKKILSK